jgi:signal transduction histidine kinase
VLFALAIWVALGRALRPVDQLRRAAAEVARSGGPGSLPVPRTDDELGALARTLNEMLDRLERSAARQRAFVADAAHELRSPVAALRASIDVAQTHPGAYRTDELAAELGGEVLRMQALVDDLLLLARVGSTSSPRTDIDLRAVADDAVAATRAASRLASATPVETVVDIVGSGRAMGEPTALVRVLRNLVDNAARHAAGQVQVTVADGSVTVDDDGDGISKADRGRVFERFVRLDDARQREAGGSGLGLAIAREIARDQQGDVTLGVSPAGGLRAVLRLPTAGDQRRTARAGQN